MIVKSVSVHSINFVSQNFARVKSANNVFTLPYDTVNFKGKAEKENDLPYEISKNLAFGVDVSDIIEKSIDKQNIIGKGANSTVYKIPDLDDYVLKVLNKNDHNKIDVSEFPSDINLGQPVWQSTKNPGIIILKKINGTEHSIPNWSDVIWDDNKCRAYNVTAEQAKLFNKQIKNLASMPQSSFDSVAKDVKYLDSMDYKIDSINPNNLIVDSDKQEIHIIDYYKIKPWEKHIQQNSYLDLSALMLDFTLFPEYFDKLNTKEKESMVESVKLITKKVKIAAINADLSLDDNKFKTYVNHVARWFFNRSLPNEKTGGLYFRYYDVRMEDFLNMIENPDKWAESR